MCAVVELGLAQPGVSDRDNEDNDAGSRAADLLRRFTKGWKRRRRLNSHVLDTTAQRMEHLAKFFDGPRTGKKATPFELLDDVRALHSVKRLPLETEELHGEPSNVEFLGQERTDLEAREILPGVCVSQHVEQGETDERWRLLGAFVVRHLGVNTLEAPDGWWFIPTSYRLIVWQKVADFAFQSEGALGRL